jgi:prepilin-type N-terminal cleavage/methylation domain-containing protein
MHPILLYVLWLGPRQIFGNLVDRSLLRLKDAILGRLAVGSNQNRSYANQAQQGFTLPELLVVMAISSSIIAGLMLIVVQLMDFDQREAARSETQREMQMALDYMSSELREAVYVYSGDQLRRLASGGHLPSSLTSSTMPVIAFWKHHPFPDTVKTYCRVNANNPAVLQGINCEAGTSYALVVYSLRADLPSNDESIWSGEARIVRYSLTEFKSSSSNNIPEVNQGYVNPAIFSNFDFWPFDKPAGDTGRKNLQSDNLATIYLFQSGRPTGRPTASGATAVLVDFVGDQRTAQTASCPTGYAISPSNAAVDAAAGRLKKARSFYACVRPRVTEGPIPGLGLGQNQEVLLFVQGSLRGRPAYNTTIGSLSRDQVSVLETRVLVRGVLNRAP